MSVRAAVSSDAEAIGAVNLAAWRETYAGVVGEAFLAGLRADAITDRWHSHLSRSDPAYRIVVAEAQDRIVGYAASGPTREAAPARPLELYSIYLLADHQGVGLGSALLQAAVGTAPAQLWVAAANDVALAFYRRAGFELDGAEKSLDDFDGVLTVRMIR